MNKQHDIEGLFYLFNTGEGRTSPVFSGYRPEHKIHDNYFTCGEHEYLEVNQVNLGEIAKVGVRFITPDVYPNSVWIGREINVQEGKRVIGKIVVTEIFNEVLLVDPKNYKSEWVVPPNIDMLGRKLKN